MQMQRSDGSVRHLAKVLELEGEVVQEEFEGEEIGDSGGDEG